MPSLHSSSQAFPPHLPLSQGGIQSLHPQFPSCLHLLPPPLPFPSSQNRCFFTSTSFYRCRLAMVFTSCCGAIPQPWANGIVCVLHSFVLFRNKITESTGWHQEAWISGHSLSRSPQWPFQDFTAFLNSSTVSRPPHAQQVTSPATSEGKLKPFQW